MRAPGAVVFVRIGPIRFVAGRHKRRLNRVSLVLLGLVLGVSCVYNYLGFLCAILVIVGLFCQ